MEEQRITPETSDKHTEPRRTSGCFHFLAGAVVVVAMLIAAAPFVVRGIISWKMGPAQLALIEDNKKKPIHVPPDWLEVKPFPKDYRDIMHSWFRDWKTSGSLLKLTQSPNLGTTLTEEQWTSATEEIENGRAFITHAREAAKHPAHDLDVAMSPEFGMYDKSPFGAFQIASELIRADARLKMRNGDCSGALELCLDNLRLSKRHPASTLITHLVGVAMESNTNKAIVSIASECTDTLALEHTLAEMNLLEPHMKMKMHENIMMQDNLGMMRTYAREGFPIKLQNDKPIVFHMDELMKARMQYASWQVNNLPPGDPYTPERKAYLQLTAPTTTSSPKPFDWVNAILGGMPKDLLFAHAVPNFQEAGIRVKVTIVKYDLARLYLAKRIAVLKGAEETSATAKQVLGGMTLLDEFDTSSPLRISDNADFYSIGPDMHDNRTAIEYDPSNGTRSVGDILWRRN